MGCVIFIDPIPQAPSSSNLHNSNFSFFLNYPPGKCVLNGWIPPEGKDDLPIMNIPFRVFHSIGETTKCVSISGPGSSLLFSLCYA